MYIYLYAFCGSPSFSSSWVGGEGGGGEEKKIELQVSSLERNLKKFHEVYEISVQGKKRG